MYPYFVLSIFTSSNRMHVIIPESYVHAVCEEEGYEVTEEVTDRMCEDATSTLQELLKLVFVSILGCRLSSHLAPTKPSNPLKEVSIVVQ